MDKLEKVFTGAIERVQKAEDVLIGSFITATRPDTFMPNFTGVIEDQKQTPSCGAHAGQSVKQILESFEGSPEYLWKKIKLIDGIPPESGTTMDAIFKVLQKTGITSITLMPNNSLQSVKDYTDPSTISPAMDSEAQNHKVGPYAFTFNPTLEQLKQAIYDHKAVIMLLRVGAEWWRDKTNTFSTWQEKDILPLRTDIPITSGHFVTAFAYDENYIYFINEWSDAWGKKGLGYFGADYMPRCVEIGTTVNLETSKYIFSKTLKLGSTGFDVKQLQTKLGIVADGIFGPHTADAVRAFQASHGLTADGVVGPLTNIELNK